ncbi:hypothetical protein [Polaromonas sp. JS666]|uniref:hypothetical protein n=1 Tax=Polaromonas sp. (strain JS666 / ATCC BAA-500) TaxID=296591 RepID=UPI00059B63BF|nr:hypothetical protein [Polaromonas sp. JS666]
MQTSFEHNRSYNKLPTVFDADLALRQRDRDSVIEELLIVIEDHGLQNSVGLRLLHRHNEIAESEVMLEEARFDEHGLALVTLASPVAAVDSTVAANSWMLDGDEFIAVEYSRASLLQSPGVSPKTQPLFFSALQRKLREFDVETWVGPALIESDFVSSHSQGRELLLEQSAFDDRANVLRYVSIDEIAPSGVVETFWVASVEAATRKSPATKAPGGTKTIKKVCKRICPSVQNPPVHQGTFIHT